MRPSSTTSGSSAICTGARSHETRKSGATSGLFQGVKIAISWENSACRNDAPPCDCEKRAHAAKGEQGGDAAMQIVRPAAVAGAFYPSDPSELKEHVDALLARAV